MAADDVVAKAVDPILKTVDTTVQSTIVDPGFLTEIGFGLLSLVIIITVHGWCLAGISKQFSRRFGRYTPKTRAWRVRVLMIVTIALLALTHFFETLIWAGPIWHFGLITNFRDAYYFVLESYTTLGESTVSLPEPWRLGGPIIAISGLFTFSWTGSVLVYVMTEIGRRHALDSKSSAQQKPNDHGPAA